MIAEAVILSEDILDPNDDGLEARYNDPIKVVNNDDINHDLLSTVAQEQIKFCSLGNVSAMIEVNKVIALVNDSEDKPYLIEYMKGTD